MHVKKPRLHPMLDRASIRCLGVKQKPTSCRKRKAYPKRCRHAQKKGKAKEAIYESDQEDGWKQEKKSRTPLGKKKKKRENTLLLNYRIG